MTVNSLLISIINRGIIFVTQLGGMVKEISRDSINQNPFELVFMLFEAQRGNEESKRKSIHLKGYWERKRASKTVFLKKCPAWVKWDTAELKYKEIPERADIVRRIYEMYAEGYGEKKIIQILNSQGVKPFGKKRWGSYVSKILKFPAVIGEMTLSDSKGDKTEAIANFYPKVVSDSLWLKVVRLRELKVVKLTNAISKNTGKTGMKLTRFASNLFTSIATCGHCGGKINFKYGIKKMCDGSRKKHRYLVCVSKTHGINCPSFPWKYEDFEESFLEFAREVSISQTDCTKDEMRVRDFEKALQATERSIGNLENAIAELGEDTDSISGLAKKLSALNIKKKEILNEIKQARQAIEDKVKMNTIGLSALGDLLAMPDNSAIRLKVAQQIRVYFNEVKLFSGGKIITEAEGLELQKQIEPECGLEMLVEIMKHPRKHTRYYQAFLKNGDHRIVVPDHNNPKVVLLHLDGGKVQFLGGEMKDISSIQIGGEGFAFGKKNFEQHILSAFLLVEAQAMGMGSRATA